MKNIDIGDIRPREVFDIEDDKNQVLSNSNVQASGSHDQIQASTSDGKCKINKWLVHHLNQVINQTLAIKCKCFNQPMLQDIIHWTLSLAIFQEVCKQDQDWLHFVSISHLCHPLNLRR
jgi:hypothetical protein